jgi:hypothetical protein
MEVIMQENVIIYDFENHAAPLTIYGREEIRKKQSQLRSQLEALKDELIWVLSHDGETGGAFCRVDELCCSIRALEARLRNLV